jgi:hypothetical protein
VSKATLMSALLIASLAVAAAEELPVRDPMRPFGHDAGGAVGATAPAGPRFALTGVVISPLRRVAIVNGKPYRQGESVDGAEIVAIEAHAVRLRDGGTELVIPLGRAR